MRKTLTRQLRFQKGVPFLRRTANWKSARFRKWKCNRDNSLMSHSENSEVYKTVDHLFRHEAGKMVSVLTRIFGFPNIEQAEDIVQDTLVKALEVWKWGKIPDNPQAWLYKVAKNKALDLIRREKLKYKIENEIAILLKSEYSLAPLVNEMFTV